jgi:hypothetical protein
VYLLPLLFDQHLASKHFPFQFPISTFRVQRRNNTAQQPIKMTQIERSEGTQQKQN